MAQSEKGNGNGSNPPIIWGTTFLKIAMNRLAEQSLVVILLLLAIYFINRQNTLAVDVTSKRIDDLETNVRDCHSKYDDLLKMYYYSHAEVPSEPVTPTK